MPGLRPENTRPAFCCDSRDLRSTAGVNRALDACGYELRAFGRAHLCIRESGRLRSLCGERFGLPPVARTAICEECWSLVPIVPRWSLIAHFCEIESVTRESKEK